MGHFDTDTPAAVVIYDADSPKVPRDGSPGLPSAHPKQTFQGVHND